jgi:hypothetical protein
MYYVTLFFRTFAMGHWAFATSRSSSSSSWQVNSSKKKKKKKKQQQQQQHLAGPDRNLGHWML